MKREEFRQVLKLAVLDVAERFGKQFIGDAPLEQYVDDLMHGMTPEQIAKLPIALGDHRRDGKFFPSTGEIRERVGQNSQTKFLQKLAWIDDYVKQWGVARMGAARRVVVHNKPVFILQNPPEIPEDIAYALKQAGGYEYFANHEQKADAFVRRDFLSALEALEKAGPQREELLSQAEAVKSLAGIEEKARQLLPAPEPEQEKLDDRQAAAAEILGPKVPRELSQEEFEQRMKLLAEQKERLLGKQTG